jgi:hypothetical protein
MQRVGCDKGWEELPRLIIIDGLDECQDSKIQKQLIETIIEPFTTEEQFPLQFLICSCPEPVICETFDEGMWAIASRGWYLAEGKVQ